MPLNSRRRRSKIVRCEDIGMKSQIRWGRIALAAVLSEIGVIAVLGAVIAADRFLIAPGLTDAQYQEFARNAGYYAASPAAGIAMFLAVLWMSRKLTSRFIFHGTLAGFAAVLLTLGFLFAARPADRLMYAVSYAVRILAGYLGGLAAQTRYQRRNVIAAGPAREVA